MDSANDPIPAPNKVTNVAQLVTNEKRAGLRNMQVITVPASPGPAGWWTLDFFPVSAAAENAIRIIPGPSVGDVSFVFPKVVKFADIQTAASGRRRAVIPGAAVPRTGLIEQKLLARDQKLLQEALGERSAKYDLTKAVAAPKGQNVRVAGLKLPAEGVRAAIRITPPDSGQSWLTVVQESNGEIVGGNTYIFVPETKS